MSEIESVHIETEGPSTVEALVKTVPDRLVQYVINKMILNIWSAQQIVWPSLYSMLNCNVVLDFIKWDVYRGHLRL